MSQNNWMRKPSLGRTYSSPCPSGVSSSVWPSLPVDRKQTESRGLWGKPAVAPLLPVRTLFQDMVCRSSFLEPSPQCLN